MPTICKNSSVLPMPAMCEHVAELRDNGRRPKNKLYKHVAELGRRKNIIVLPMPAE